MSKPVAEPATLKSREELRRRVINAFSEREEVWRINVFGREVEGQEDAYSDLDLIVDSSDPARTRADYLEVFTKVAPVWATFTLGGTADWFCQMLMLRGYSPYQKIDFSIGGKEDWKCLTVYENPGKGRESRTAMAPVVLEGNAAHILNDVLFSIARFTKCLFRRDVDMYRRWESITDLALVLLYERHFGWEAETATRRLGPQESKALSDALSPEDAVRLDQIRPCCGHVNLATSYQSAVHLIAALSRQKARHFGATLDEEFIEEMLCFLDSEIERYEADSRKT